MINNARKNFGVSRCVLAISPTGETTNFTPSPEHACRLRSFFIRQRNTPGYIFFRIFISPERPPEDRPECLATIDSERGDDTW